MINFIKQIWSGPASVKLSLVFVLFVLAMIIIAKPGATIFSLLLLTAVFRIAQWLDETDNK